MTNYVYLFRRLSDDLIKIGMSGNPEVRIKTIHYKQKDEIIRCAAYGFNSWDSARIAERDLHNIFHSRRITGEWFKVSAEQVCPIVERMQQFMNCGDRKGYGIFFRQVKGETNERPMLPDYLNMNVQQLESALNYLYVARDEFTEDEQREHQQVIEIVKDIRQREASIERRRKKVREIIEKQSVNPVNQNS